MKERKRGKENKKDEWNEIVEYFVATASSF